MSSIYYPYFLIERNIHKQYNHKRNIILLSLFSKDILIPIRHILLLGEDEFDILMKYSELTKKGVLYFRIPKDTTDINQYYDNISSSMRQIPINKINYRTTKLNGVINDISKIKKYDPQMQQTYYSERIKHFTLGYITTHNKLKKICRNELSKIVEIDLLTKEVYDESIKQLYDRNIISSDVYTRLRNASMDYIF